MKRIYISDGVHQVLKKEAAAEGRTLQWVVENRLTSVNTPSPKNTKVVNPAKVITIDESTPYSTSEKKSEADASVADLIKEPAQTAVVEDMEQMCCKNDNQPCKHWIWDTSTGEGYVNILSGRMMEVE